MSKKAGKKKKDPMAPKRAMSGFMFYSNAVRDTVRKEKPDIAFTEVAKVIGAQWKELSEDDRKPYHDMATKDKERYAKAMLNYTPDPTLADGNRKKKKDPNAPKRGMSAYLFFCSEHRADLAGKNPELKMTDIAKLLAQKWKETSDEDKKPFNEKAAADKARYQQEMEAYNA